MLPHQKRVIKEKEELDDKIEKLQSFINSDFNVYEELPVEEKIDLSLQLEYMKGYSIMLQSRINRFKTSW